MCMCVYVHVAMVLRILRQMISICTACDSSCTGLTQCYGPNANQCCSYNNDGNCVADCGMNREGNSTFHCVCSNFWIGDNCDGMFE